MAVKIYEVCAVIVDIFIFVTALIFNFIYGIYEVIVPPKERSVANEIVLVSTNIKLIYTQPNDKFSVNT